MAMTRREFLGCAAAATLPIQARGRETQCWLIAPDGDSPMLRESVLGYRSALPSGLEVNEIAALAVFPSSVHTSADRIDRHLRSGSTVIVESGAGFSSDVEYQAHRRWMREQFDITTKVPMDLWSGCTRGVPYIEYDWPVRASVRDFSRVVPVADQPGEVIGWVGDVAVALRRRIGRGTLIYLGSPLGPAIWAGDRQARRWLHQVFAS